VTFGGCRQECPITRRRKSPCCWQRLSRCDNPPACSGRNPSSAACFPQGFRPERGGAVFEHAPPPRSSLRPNPRRAPTQQKVNGGSDLYFDFSFRPLRRVASLSFDQSCWPVVRGNVKSCDLTLDLTPGSPLDHVVRSPGVVGRVPTAAMRTMRPLLRSQVASGSGWAVR
jgi:hypothetical protein